MTTPNEPTQTSSTFMTALLSGALAGTTVDLSLFPLDTLKTRLQSSSGFLASGGFTGVYRGVGSAIIGSAPGAALFFCTYESIKGFFSTQFHTRSAQPFLNDGIVVESESTVTVAAPMEHILAASFGEIAACAVRVPTDVIKQRAQAGHQSSSLIVLKSILSQRQAIGLSGVWLELYRGWTITVMREIPFTVIQFPLWEAMKEYRRKTKGEVNITAFESAIFGSIAGAIAAGFTTPLDVLKTRMMLARERTNIIPLFTQIITENGPRAFFAGIGPRVLWISAGGAIFLGSYQWSYNYLSKKLL
ncbi:s-adenosylmethionine mitochondrial carrier protein-like protein [Erysiphe pulchra]|uniref:S-adenosylmethionine mitochondrial carrier protein-like protein n=1 Tax=Erysiphe pulchra TaxID=225359 RepID=A0A2S4PZN7_9PEZI|nr:s-adenosylmethionine mitochondrial carrier protein-like protein [Erysiphe pulchra]